MTITNELPDVSSNSEFEFRYQLNGLPANLLASSSENKPPLYALIGLHNREARKHMAKKLRKSCRAPKTVSDDELISQYFTAQQQRLNMFWRTGASFGVKLEAGSSPIGQFGPSLNHSLIAHYDGAAFETVAHNIEAEMRQMGVPWDDIVENLQTKYPDHFSASKLGFLGTWKGITHEFPRWEILEEDRQHLIANAVFAMSSATDNPYFMNRAVADCKHLALEFLSLIDGNEDSITEVMSTSLEHIFNTKEEQDLDHPTDAATDNWADLVAELNALTGRMAQEGPSQELVGALHALSGRFDQVQIPNPVSMAAVLERLHGLLGRYEGGDDGELYAPILEDLRQILSRWRLLAYQADAQALADLYADLDQRAVAAAPFEAQYVATARTLAMAIASCEEVQRRVANGPLAKKAKLRLELKICEQQRDTSDDQLTQNMVSLFGALNYKGEEFDTSRDWTAELENELAKIGQKRETFFGPTGLAAVSDEQAMTPATAVTEQARAYEHVTKAAEPSTEPSTEPVAVPTQSESIAENSDVMTIAPETELATVEAENLVEGPVSPAPVAKFVPAAPASISQTVKADEAPPIDSIHVSGPEETSSEQIQVRDHFWELIASGEYSLAYHLSLAADPTPGVPSPNVLRLLVLGTELAFPHGASAKALEDAVIAFDADADLASVSGAHDAATNLLLAAATVRSCLLAPATGANDILQHECSLGSGWDNLHQLTQTVAQSAHQMHGVILSPDAFRQHKADKTFEATREAIKAEAETWLDGNSKSRLTFQPATQIWHQWVGKEGRINKLLSPLIDPAATMTPEWRDLLSEMANPDDVEAQVQESDRAMRGNRYGNIDYRALDQLKRRVAEAVTMVRRGMSIKDAQPKSDFMDRSIKSLDQSLEQIKSAAYAEVEAAQQKHRGDASTRAAARCLQRELDRLYDLFAAAPAVAPEERPASLALNADLLLLPGIHLDAGNQPVASKEIIAEALMLYKPGSANISMSVVTKMDEGDFDAAQWLIDWGFRKGVEDCPRLAETFEFRLNEARDALRVQYAQTLRQLENSFRAGLVADADRDQMMSILTDIESRITDIRRIDAAKVALEEVIARVNASTAARINEVKERIAVLMLPEGDPRLAAIAQLLDKGDALAAEEYIDHLARGETPPSSDQADEELSTFPSFLVQAPNHINLGEAEAAIRAGQDWQGLSFSSFSEAARQESAGLVAAWNAMKRQKRPGVEPVFDPNNVYSLMTAIGFRLASAASVSMDNRSISRIDTSVRAQPLADRRICPAPEFGSEARGTYRVICVYPKTQELEATEISPPKRAVTAATIVLFMGQLSREGRQKLLRQNLNARRSYIVVDETVILYLAMQAQGRLRAMFAATLPYTVTDPYRIKQAGIVPPEMFFGRSSEREAIMSPHGAASVYGGRQLGKTVLLKEIERLLHDPAAHSLVQWVDLPGHNVGRSCKPEALWTIVVRELHRFGVVTMDWPEFRETDAKHVARVIEDIRKWLDTNPDGRILLLLDEADEFLKEEATEDYPVTRQLKALMERTDGRFKTVFVGLHNVLRSTRAANNPLVHLNAVEIGPLYARGESRAAFEMVRRPFAALGYVFDDDSHIMRILAACNYYPNLINLVCRKLLEKLRNRADAAAIDPSKGVHVITEKVVSETYEQTALRDEIRHYFLLTLELDARYELIANWMAMEYLQKRLNSAEGVPALTIRTAATALWPEGFRATSDNEFDALLMEMVGLGVLRRTSGNSFSFRNPNVLQLMGTTAEIDERLTKIAVEGELKPGFDATTFRGPLTASVRDPRRSPLSIVQEHLIAAQENGVVVVCGAPLSGLSDVQEALSHRHLISNIVPTASLSIDLAEKDLDALRAKPKTGVNILLVPDTKPWNAEWLNRFHNNLKARVSSSSFVRALFEAGPALLWQMAKDNSLDRLEAHNAIVLKPWVDPYLWIWLEDMNLPLQKNLRQAILNATDGRPGLIMQLHSDLDGGPRINERIEAFAARIATPERANAVLIGLGVSNEQAYKGLLVFKQLPGESLTDIERFWPEIGPNCVALPSFVRWAELLCLIRPVGPDRWELEPFVTRLLDAVGK